MEEGDDPGLGSAVQSMGSHITGYHIRKSVRKSKTQTEVEW